MNEMVVRLLFLLNNDNSRFTLFIKIDIIVLIQGWWKGGFYVLLEVENLGIVEQATIKVNHITVIAGCNSTGKSTLSKALYSLLLPFNDYEKKVNYERTKSINYRIRTFLKEKELSSLFLKSIDNLYRKIYSYYKKHKEMLSKEEFYELLEHLLKEDDLVAGYQNDDKEFYEKESMKLYSHLAELYDIIQSTVEKNNKEFNHRILELTHKTILGNLSKQNNKMCLLSLKEAEREICKVKNDLRNGIVEIFSTKTTNVPYIAVNVIYIENSSIIDELNNRIGFEEQSKNIYGNNLLDLLKLEKQSNVELSEEEQQERELFIKKYEEIFENILHGKLVVDNYKYYFKSFDDKKMIDVRQLSSGMKCLLVIQRLIYNGSLNKNTVLIIDEPETNLHPEWQIFFAEILVRLSKDLDIKIIINSHSPYFVRAIEVMMAHNMITDKGNYYLMVSNGEQMFRAENVTTHIDEIYKYLYRPLDELVN